MPVYRFKQKGIRSTEVQEGTGGSALSFSDVGNAGYLDVTATVGQLADLIVAMAEQGFVFDSTDPVTSIVEESSGEINHNNLLNAGSNTHAQLDSHVASTANPHSVTKAQIGLGNVDNTSDADKPVSTAVQAEIDLAIQVRKAVGISHMNSADHWLDHIWSAGSVDGCEITNNGNGTVNIAAGEAILRATNNPMAALKAVLIPATNNIALTDNATNFITITYGDPNATVGVTIDPTAFNCRNICHIYRIVREGTDLHIINNTGQNTDANRNARVISHRSETFKREIGTAQIGVSGAALTSTAGRYWYAFDQIDVPAFDTTIAGTANVNVFRRYYTTAGGGSWNINLNQKTVTYQYNNNGTLTALGTNQRANWWIYLILGNDECHLAAVVGEVAHGSLAAATAESAPTNLPTSLTGAGVLIGRLVVRGNSTIEAVQSAFTTNLALAPVTDHNDLANIGTNTHTQIDSHIASTANPHSTSDANLVTTDITTNNVSTSKHGFFPKLPTPTGAFLRDDLSWQTISGGGDMLAANNLSDVADVVTARNNILPSKAGNSLRVLRVNAGETDYEVVALSGVTNGDSHDHSGGDGAQINHTTLSNIGTNTHAQIDTFISSKASASGLASLDATSRVVQAVNLVWDGIAARSASATPSANIIPVTGAGGTIASGFIPDLSSTYAVASLGVTNGNSHDHSGGDGAQINHTTLSNIGTNTHAQIDTHIASTSNPHSVTAAQAGALATSAFSGLAKISVGTAQPVGPSIGDLWIDTN